MKKQFYALGAGKVAQVSRLCSEHVSASKSVASVGFAGGTPALL